jgi:RNA-directed DNA polymerase
MRKHEGIEPRDEQRIVGADLLSNREGHIQGAQGQGSREPTGVGDRGTSAGQDRELGRSDALLQSGGRAVQSAHREDAQRRIGRRMPLDEQGRGVTPAEQRGAHGAKDLRAMLAERIMDRRFLHLIARMLKAGVQTPGGVVQDERGSPQGSMVSPVIANVFVDKVLDQWVATTVKAHCRGYCARIRDADDTRLVCAREDEAQRVMRVLPRRRATFGLRLNAQNTRLVAFGKRSAWRALNAGQRPPTLDFLGLTHYWGRSRRGLVRVKRKTSRKRLRRALVAISQWLRQERHERPLPDLWQAVARKMRGHFNDVGVTDNSPALWPFDHAVRQLLFTWLNRRSQRRSFSWERFRR